MGASASSLERTMQLRVQNNEFPVTNLENLFLFHPFEALLGSPSVESVLNNHGVPLMVGVVGNTDPTKMAGDLTLTMNLLRLMPVPTVLITDYRTCGVYRKAGYRGPLLLTNFLQNDNALWFGGNIVDMSSPLVDTLVAHVGDAPNQNFEETSEVLQLLNVVKTSPEVFDFLIFSNVLGSVTPARYRIFIDSFSGMNRFRYFIFTEYNMQRASVAFSNGHVIQTGLPLDMAYNLLYVSSRNFDETPILRSPSNFMGREMESIETRIRYIQLIQPLGVFLSSVECAIGSEMPQLLLDLGLTTPYIFTYLSFLSPDDPEVLVYFIVFIAIALRVWATKAVGPLQVLTFKTSIQAILVNPQLSTLWSRLVLEDLAFSLVIQNGDGSTTNISPPDRGPQILFRSDITSLPPAQFRTVQQFSIPLILLTGDQSVSEMIACTQNNFRLLFYHPLAHKQIFKRGLCNTIMPFCNATNPLLLQDYFTAIADLCIQNQVDLALDHIIQVSYTVLDALDPQSATHRQIANNFELVRSQYNLEDHLVPILRAITAFFGLCNLEPEVAHALSDLVVRADQQMTLLPLADRTSLLMDWQLFFASLST